MIESLTLFPSNFSISLPLPSFFIYLFIFFNRRFSKIAQREPLLRVFK